MRRPNRRPTYLKTEDIKNYEIAPDYLIYKDGADTIAVNGSTGKEDSRDTDATIPIQYALDNTYFGKIVLKSAAYVIHDTLTMPNPGVELCGQMFSTPPTAQGLYLADDVNKTMLLVNALKCRVHDLWMYANKANQTDGYCIETLTHSSLDLHLSHCYLIHGKDGSLLWTGGAGVADHVYSEYSDGTGFAIRENEGTGNRLTSCGSYFDDVGFALLGHDNILNGCTIRTAGTYGLMLEGGGCHGNIVNGLRIQSVETNGIWVYGGHNNIITNNLLSGIGNRTNNTYKAIYLSTQGGSNHAHHNIIEGNRIFSIEGNKHQYGIREEDANQDYNIITGNNVTDAVTANISTQGVNDVVANNIS